MNIIKQQLKKFLYISALTIGSLTGLSVPRALADVEINIGEEAVAQDLPGTANSAATDGGFGYWIGRVLNIALVFAALLVLSDLVVAGFEWITAAGDNGKLQKARDRIIQSIIGLIVLTATVALFILVQNFLGIEIVVFTFGSTP